MQYVYIRIYIINNANLNKHILRVKSLEYLFRHLTCKLKKHAIFACL